MPHKGLCDIPDRSSRIKVYATKSQGELVKLLDGNEFMGGLTFLKHLRGSASRGLRPRECSVKGEIFFGSNGCDAGLGEKNAELGEKIEGLREKNPRLRVKNPGLRVKKLELRVKKLELREKNAELHEKNAELREKKVRLREKKAELREKNPRLQICDELLRV